MDAEAASAHSSAQVMFTGHVARPPSSTASARVRRQDVEWKCASQVFSRVVGHAWTAYGAAGHRKPRLCSAGGGRSEARWAALATVDGSQGWPVALGWAFNRRGDHSTSPTVVIT